MKAETFTVISNRPRDEVFAFLADIENLPKWATGFARELKIVDGDYKVVTPDGELYLAYQTDAGLGVIDIYAGPTRDQMGVFPIRVVTAPDGSTAATMTLFQTPDIDDKVFAQQVESLKHETENLHRLLA
jgi:hypothetical protein